MPWLQCFRTSLLAVVLLLMINVAQAAIGLTNKISDIRGTKHNLSSAPSGTVYTYYLNRFQGGGSATSTVPGRTVMATSEDQVCVFCHTPHGATTGNIAPLWNRKYASQTYTLYPASTTANASSMDATDIKQPGGSSKLCLSCHDGTMAINEVNVLNGATNVTIGMSGLSASNTMPAGLGKESGFTRNLGINLSNDHPISFTYNDTLANADGELRLRIPDNTVSGVVMNRLIGKEKPVLPLENDQIQCATCHDPHIRDRNEASNGNAKFLRANRFQAVAPTGDTFNVTNDIICLACHDKAGTAWAYSVHANKDVASQTYVGTDPRTKAREFPDGAAVWQVACLNCHDTHTVQGARRLLREGTSTTLTAVFGGTAASGIQIGVPGNALDFSMSAIEKTCYQCHGNGISMITQPTTVPNIEADFKSLYRMPITSRDQGTTSTPASLEVHDIGSGDATQGSQRGKDFIEARSNLGAGLNLGNRHAECTDCHNPHRVIKARNGLPGALASTNTKDAGATHQHATSTTHSNIISGVLRGSWGVEPSYASTTFSTMPTFPLGNVINGNVKRGDPGSASSTATSETYVTREYQICLKCHSNYAYEDDNVYPNSNFRPQLMSLVLGRTSSNTAISSTTTTTGGSGFTSYTNQAKEFQAPSGMQGPSAAGGCLNLGNASGAASTTAKNPNGVSYDLGSCNHRSWHPVMAPTGRLATTRGNGTDISVNWNAPFNYAVGTQTMYCSDCHGSDNGTGTTATGSAPLSGKPWGPHGSINQFILRGKWDTDTGNNQDANGLCFKCHTYATYATDSGNRTGFYDGGSTNKGDLHSYHANKMPKMRCNWCHVAVPHGWKNKALLVNLRDVGPEDGKAVGTDVGVGPYTSGPYYRNAMLRIWKFAPSGKWQRDYCGGMNYMKDTMCNGPP